MPTLSIRAKLTVTFAAFLALVLVLGAVSMNGLASLGRASGEIADIWLASLRHASEARTYGTELRVFALRRIIASDDGVAKDMGTRIASSLDRIRKSLESYAAIEAAHR